MDVGFAGQGRNASANNKKLRGARSSYKKVKQLYVGVGNDSDNPHYVSPLTAEELKKGRKRVIAYYTKRNRRIYSLVILFGILAVALFGYGVFYLLR